MIVVTKNLPQKAQRKPEAKDLTPRTEEQPEITGKNKARTLT
jgi:hypothetical protein